jgi:hypothetical protein
MTRKGLKTYPVLIAIVAGGLAWRLWVAWHDVTLLLVKCIPDDSFFVFRIARNLAEGQGLTFDGVIPSNSPRLVWELLLAGVLKIIPANDYLAAHVILTLGGIADAVTIVVLFLLVRTLFRSYTSALLTAGAYAFLPYAVRQANNGLETALAVALLSLGLLFYVNLVRKTPYPKWRFYALGVFCGAIILTRLDYALLPALLFVDLIRRPSGKAPSLYLATGVATIVVPWVIFSVVKFGEVLPSSGYAVTYLYYTHYLEHHPLTLGGLLGRSWFFFFKAFRYYAYPFFTIKLAYFGPIAFALLALAAVVSYVRANSTDREKLRLVLIPTAIIWILLIVHGFLLWYAREWHTGPSLFATVLLGGSIFALATAKLKTRGRAIATVVAVLLLVPAYAKVWHRVWTAEPYRPFLSHYRVSIWARDNLPADAVMASFDGGIPGYFSHLRVVDLVGIENENAFAAIRERRLGAYLDEAGIDYLHVMPVRLYPEYDWLWGEDIKKRLSEPLYEATDDESPPDWRTAQIRRVIHR